MPFVLFNKPHRVLSQFRDRDGRPTLGDFVNIGNVYPAGRLDYDSEGLILLTDDGALQAQISQPRRKIPKVYLAQVEGIANDDHAAALLAGVELKDGFAIAAGAQPVAEPDWLWPREPPIRERKNKPVSWLEITLTEGRNRQVRRMTASVGLPTLRLIRYAIGPWNLAGLAPGEFRALPNEDAKRSLRDSPGRAS